MPKRRSGDCASMRLGGPPTRVEFAGAKIKASPQSGSVGDPSAARIVDIMTARKPDRHRWAGLAISLLGGGLFDCGSVPYWKSCHWLPMWARVSISYGPMAKRKQSRALLRNLRRFSGLLSTPGRSKEIRITPQPNRPRDANQLAKSIC